MHSNRPYSATQRKNFEDISITELVKKPMSAELRFIAILNARNDRGIDKALGDSSTGAIKILSEMQILRAP